MKAIEILRHLTTFCGAELHNQCIEAIAELEVLQQPKSCQKCFFVRTCLHHKLITDPMKTMNEVDYFLNDFYCSEFKPKE